MNVEEPDGAHLLVDLHVAKNSKPRILYARFKYPYLQHLIAFNKILQQWKYHLKKKNQVSVTHNGR